jgi:tRNA(Ile)-lysidine synthase
MVLYADWLRQRGESAAHCTVLTVDHGLRATSADEARAVAALATELGYRHATLKWDGPKPRAGLQAAARTARYRLMGAHMRAHGGRLLLTAHTRDDQAETLLMRLARGSGLDGLAAMPPLSPLGERGPGDTKGGGHRHWLGRPFLDVPKACLQATLKERGVRWMEDPSNIAPEFERARLRAAQEHLDGLGLTPAKLALSAARLGRARRVIEGLVDQLCDPNTGAVRVDPSGVIVIEAAHLRRAGEEIALRVLDRAVAAAGGAHERAPLGKLEALLPAVFASGAAAAGRWTLARALITAERGTITVEREPGREPLPAFALVPGSTALWDGRFRIGVSQSFAGGTVEVHALGEPDFRDLRRRRLIADDAPARAAAATPSIWLKGELVAAPALGFWASPHLADELQAEFIGLGQAARPPGSQPVPAAARR